MSEWVSQEAGHSERRGRAERRNQPERRRRLWWSLIYGSFRPRRRRPSRRGGESSYQAVDWHGAHLWAISIGILILSVADAFLTVALLSGGAIEANPLMAMVVGRNATLFAATKVALTGTSVMLLVFLARYRFLRFVRVEVILYCVLGAYVLLMCHEIGLLYRIPNAHLL
jgi:hypothetical protein